MINAEALNSHLAGGGRVVVGTYTKATVYNKRHAGWFTEDSRGDLYVKSGRGKNCLSRNGGKHLMVSFRLIGEVE